MQYDQLTWHIHFLPFNISYRRFYQILVKLALCLLKTFKLFKMLYDGRCFKVTQRAIIHFLRFFCRYNQDSFYVLTYYSLRYFKIWNFFNQVFCKFKDVFSFFVVLLRTLSILRQGQESYCSNLAGFFCFVVAVLLFAAEGVSCLTPVLWLYYLVCLPVSTNIA